MPAYSTDELVAAVRRLAYLPDASDIAAADILALANEELVTLATDAIKAGREEFWVTYEDTALTSSTTRVALPRRALGNGVRGIQLGNSDGVFFTIPQIDPVAGWNGRTTQINSYCYSFQSNDIVFPGLPPSGYTLRVWYLRRPSKLVPVAEAAAIEKAVSTTSLSITTAPTAFNSIKYQYFDIVRGSAPFDLMYVDRQAKNISAPGTISLNPATPVVVADFVDQSTIPNERSDYLCFRDQTVYPPLPIELQPVLEAATARRVMGDVLRDMEGAAAAQATYEARKRAAVDIVEPRNQEGSRPIVRANSPLRRTFGIGRRWR